MTRRLAGGQRTSELDAAELSPVWVRTLGALLALETFHYSRVTSLMRRSSPLTRDGLYR